MRWRRTRRSPIGVEVTPAGVRLMQIEWRGDSGRVAACAEVARPQGEGEDGSILPEGTAAEVRTALKDQGFGGGRAVVGLPSERAILRHVKVDSIEGQALRDALLFELEDAFPGDAPVVQHLEVGEVMERGEARHELILLAAGLAQVNEFVGCLEKAGLAPLAIDAEGCALIRCFTRRRRRQSDAETHTAIINIGDAATLMTISGGEHPLFMKQLPIGAAQLLEIIQQRLDLTREDVRYAARSAEGVAELGPQIVSALRQQIDSLSLEVSACLRYHAASRRSPGGLELVLCGVGAGIPGLPEALAESLEAVIQRPDPFSAAFSGIESDARLEHDFAAWSIPLGLALREVRR
ncbi:MAG: pilus assembly protein PilM [Planctomycetes bacterium]|nr:pilus assembly protein PilM [Planctomycetota bacterium]